MKPQRYRVRINLVPAPRGHDFGRALEVLAAIGRRNPGAAATAQNRSVDPEEERRGNEETP